MSTEAVAYYKGILERGGPDFVFPIRQLVGYRGQAPINVQNIALNEGELTAFLARFPSVFEIKNGSVQLRYNRITGDKIQRTVEYYSSVIKQYSSCSGMTINSLFGHRGQAPSDVMTVVKNALELRTFLVKHPEAFRIKDDCVFLIHVGLSEMDTSRFSSLNINDRVSKPRSAAVKYFSNVLNKIGRNKKVPIAQIINCNLETCNCDVPKNEADLIIFFTNYPEIFIVTDDHCVILRSTTTENNDTDVINAKSENLQKYCGTAAAVKYYAGVLEEKGLEVETPIMLLRQYWRNAPQDVQNCASNEEEMFTFLSNHPDTFTVTPNRGVVLTKSLSQNNSEKKGLQQTFVTNKGESDSESAVTYYHNVLKKLGPKSVYKIQRLVGYRGQATPNVKNIAKNQLELTIFLKKYPSIFIVEQDKYVRINIASIMDQTSNLSSDGLQPDENSLNSSENSLNSSAAVDYYREILDRYSPNCEFPLDILIKYRVQATPAVQETARNITELRAFLSKHSNIFTLKEGNVLLSVVSHSTEEAIMYYQKVLLNTEEKKLSLQALLEYRCKAPPDVKYVVKNEIQLEKLLSSRPSIFIIHHGYVYLKAYHIIRN